MSSLFSSRHLGRLSSIGVLALLLIAGCGDGEDGQTPIVQSDTADEETCPYGGTVITTGYADDSGQIADGDIIDQSVVCNGAPGATGEEGDAGDAGEEGRDAIVQTSTEDPGDNCEQGGVAIETGFDESGDGDIDEVADVTYLCNLDQCSTGQPLDFELHTDDLPDQFVDGFSYEMGVTVNGETPDNLAVSAINAGINEVDVEASFDEDEQVIVLDHLEGEGKTSLAIVVSDGCDTATETFTFGPFEEGLADIVVGHLFPGAGEVTVWDVDADMDDDDPIAELDDFDFSDPVELPWGTYEFEIFDADDDSLGTTGDIDIAPFTTNLVYAYNDGDGLGINAFEIDDPELDDEFSLRAHHLADEADDVDIYAVTDDDSSLLFENVGFTDVSDPTTFDADTEASAGIDSNQDGTPDLEYTSTTGAFADGAHLEAFAVYNDDVVMLVTYDHVTGTSMVHDYRLLTFVSFPGVSIDFTATDTIEVSGCDVIDDLTISVETDHWWRGDLTVDITAPNGDTIRIHDTTGFSGDLIATWPFPEDSALDDAEDLLDLIGTTGNGTWTIDVVDTWEPSAGNIGTLEFWSVNLICD